MCKCAWNQESKQTNLRNLCNEGHSKASEQFVGMPAKKNKKVSMQGKKVRI